MKIIITTWDDSSSILTAFAHQADKYVPAWDELEFVILGYTKFPTLPKRYSVKSMGNKQKSWSRDIYNYLKNIQDEYVIFGTDDLLLTGAVDWKVFTHTFTLMHSDNTIMRYELGTGHGWHGSVTQLEDCGDFKIYQYGNESLYRISAQFSIWRRKYLLKYLDFDRTPWEFEIDGSREADTDGMNIIATKGKVAFQYIHSVSTKRYPGKINVANMKHDDVEELISLGIFDRSVLQTGEELNSPKYT